MGCKICKPKILDCLTCPENTDPKEIFCFSKKECSTPYAMVRNGKIIGYESESTDTKNRELNEKTIEEKALEVYPVKYTREMGVRQHPDINKPLREAWLDGVKYGLEISTKSEQYD